MTEERPLWAREKHFNPIAVLCPDDIRVLSDLLAAEFPDAVYFFWNYKSDTRRPPKYPDDKPIKFYPNLATGVAAAKLPSEDRARPGVAMRLPWPEDKVDSDGLIGGRTEPDFHSFAHDYRKLGRCIVLYDDGDDYVDALHYRDGRGDSWLESLSSIPIRQYPPFQKRQGGPACLHGAYDSNDPEVSAFMKRVFALWRRLATRDVAPYSAMDESIVDQKFRTGKPIGRCALANAVDGSRRFTVCERPKESSGAILFVGARPKKQRPGKTAVA
jgi:hypothetical protein